MVAHFFKVGGSKKSVVRKVASKHRTSSDDKQNKEGWVERAERDKS